MLQLKKKKKKKKRERTDAKQVSAQSKRVQYVFKKHFQFYAQTLLFCIYGNDFYVYN